MHPAVAEAMKKAAVAWLGVGDRTPYAVWCAWFTDALFVVTGPGEQPAPGLDGAESVVVIARGDQGGRVVTWRAAVERVAPGTDTWDTIVTQLAGKRLNSATAPDLAARWAVECLVTRLTPMDEETIAPPTGSLAAPPAPTPAVHLPRTPFHLNRRPRRRG
jgi:hypothetical protein